MTKKEYCCKECEALEKQKEKPSILLPIMFLFFALIMIPISYEQILSDWSETMYFILSMLTILLNFILFAAGTCGVIEYIIQEVRKK